MASVRAIVFGARGMLGSDVLRTAPPGVDARAAEEFNSGQRVDITHPDTVSRALERSGSDIVINAAAFTKVDLAEDALDLCQAVNAEAPGTLAAECAARSLRFVHFSTDYVFSGASTEPYRENHPVDPVNAYGLSKLLGEQAVRRSDPRSLIIRTQWLFGANGASFPCTMWNRARQRVASKVVNDQVGRPTYTVDLAKAMWDVVRHESAGLLHIANEGIASWFDVAREVFAAASSPELLEPCGTPEYPTRAKRPTYSVLDTTRAEELLGYKLPHWRNALGRFLEQLVNERSAAEASSDVLKAGR